MPNDVPSPDSAPRHYSAPVSEFARVRMPRNLRDQLRDIDRRPWQRSLRWQPTPIERRTLIAGLVVGVIACVLQWVGFGLGMHPVPREPEGRRNAVQVSIIEPETEAPIPPEPEPPPFERKISKVRVAPPKVATRPPPPTVEQPDEDSMKARIGSAGAPALQIFNPDGSIRLAKPPSGPAQAPRTPQEKARLRWAEMQKRGDNPLDCHRTRFASAYKPDLSLGDSVASKYLKYIGLADMQVIKEHAQKREARAAAGCD